MSFAGSLFLTGVGAMVYKYDQSQVFQRHPDSQLEFKDFNSKVYKKEGDSLNQRVSKAFANFFSDFFDGSAFLYPIKGIQEFFKNKHDYALTVLGVWALYLFMYVIVSMVYWATITPVYTALFAIFGPTGLILAWIHSFMQTNLLTMMFMRVCHINNHLAVTTFKRNGYENYFNKDPIRYYVPISSIYFWTFYLPLKLVKYFIGFITLVGLLVISSIPLIGPPMFHLLVSPFIAKVYFSKSLRLKGLNNIQRYNGFFEHFGQYYAFGISASALENFPIFTGFALCTNTISGALWAIEQSLNSHSN